MSVSLKRPSVDEILAPRPAARPRIYAYAIASDTHKGLLKVGQTTRDVKQRVAEQLKTAAITNYTIELDESAERDANLIIGYNINGYRDRDFEDARYSREGAYVTFRLKFDQTSLGRLFGNAAR